LLPAAGTCDRGLRGVVIPGPEPDDVGGNGRVSQVPERPSCPYALFSDPGRTDARQAIAASRRGSRLNGQRWLPRQNDFGAQSHGIRTRCLRFAGRVAPPPRKTRFRLLAKLCRAGFVHPQGCDERFPSFESLPPLSSLPDATIFHPRALSGCQRAATTSQDATVTRGLVFPKTRSSPPPVKSRLAAGSASALRKSELRRFSHRERIDQRGGQARRGGALPRDRPHGTARANAAVSTTEGVGMGRCVLPLHPSRRVEHL
jgi:hypothetical protein